MRDTKLMIIIEWVQDLVESPEAPKMLATIKGLSPLCASVSLVLTSVEWMPSIPVSLAVGGSVALAAGAMWINNRSKSKVLGSLRQDLAQQVARGDALQKRLQKKDTTITSLLVMVQRAGELDNNLGGASEAELDSLRKRAGAVSTLEEQVKTLQGKNTTAEESKRRYQRLLNDKSSQLKAAEEETAKVQESLDQVQKDLDNKTEALDSVENDLGIAQNELYDSRQAESSLKAANKSLQDQVDSLNVFKTQHSEVSDRLQKRVGELEVANQSLTSEAKILKDSSNSSAAREQSLESENQSLANMITSLNEAKTKDSELIDQLQKRVSELEVARSSVVSDNDRLRRDLAQATVTERTLEAKVLRLENEVAFKETDNADNQKAAWEQHLELLDEVNQLKGQVTSLEKHKADSAASLKSAIDGENMAIFENQDLLAQVKQLTAANQSLSSQVAALEKNVAAASAAPGSVNANTDGAAKPQDTPSADDDKPSADNKGPTAEPTDKQDGAAAKEDVDSPPVRKQAASKHNDKTRAQQLELRFNAKAAEYGGLLEIRPINYLEVAEQCRGFGADKLDLVVAKS